MGNPRIPFCPSFTLFMGNREYPYGMPQAMMACLHFNVSTYADNIMVVMPPFNPYLASSSIINNLSRTTPLSGGSNYAPKRLRI